MSHTRYSKVHHLFLFFFNIESCGWIGAIAKKLSMEKIESFCTIPNRTDIVSVLISTKSITFLHFYTVKETIFLLFNLLNKCGLITVNSQKTESLQNIKIFLVVKPVSSVDSCNVSLIYFFIIFCLVYSKINGIDINTIDLDSCDSIRKTEVKYILVTYCFQNFLVNYELL